MKLLQRLCISTSVVAPLVEADDVVGEISGEELAIFVVRYRGGGFPTRSAVVFLAAEVHKDAQGQAQANGFRRGK